jgi:DNA-binding CsgD family transcriptional regulator
LISAFSTRRRAVAQVAPLVCVAALAVLTVIALDLYVDRRVTELVSLQLVARATDQVQFGVLPRVVAADFEPPYTPARLDELSGRLNGLVDRARQADSGVIRVNLFARDGTVLFSDVASLRGQVVSPLADERLAAALSGVPGAEISSLGGTENADLEPRYHSAIEAYVPCIIDDRVVGAFEFYGTVDLLHPIESSLWAGTAISFALFAGCMLGLLARRDRSRRAPTASDAATRLVIRTGLVQLNTDTGSIRIRAGAVPGVAECWLTRREMEVLSMLATPRTYRQIAADLSLSEETVRSHVKSLLRKLKQPDRARAVTVARAAGILVESESEAPPH